MDHLCVSVCQITNLNAIRLGFPGWHANQGCSYSLLLGVGGISSLSRSATTWICNSVITHTHTHFGFNTHITHKGDLLPTTPDELCHTHKLLQAILTAVPPSLKAEGQRTYRQGYFTHKVAILKGESWVGNTRLYSEFTVYISKTKYWKERSLFAETKWVGCLNQVVGTKKGEFFCDLELVGL